MTQQLTNELMSDGSGFMSTSTSAMGVIENNQSENLLAKDNDAKEMVEPHVIAQGQKLFHFDDISNTKNYAKFGGAKLGDFDWSDNWYVKHKYGSSGTGYEKGNVSPYHSGFNGSAEPVSVTSDEEFTLDSVYLTAAWNKGLNITIEGLNDGKQKFLETVTVNNDQPNKFDFNTPYIDEIKFKSFGGTDADPNDRGSGTHFVIDNLYYQLKDDDPLEIIEDNGNASFAKHKEDGSYWAINNETKEKLQLTNKKNEIITDGDSEDWDGVAVELKTKKGKDSYQLLLDGDGEYEDNAVVWKANDEGVIKKQKLKWVTKEKKISKLEKKFEYDINGDNKIGKLPKKEDYLDNDDKIDGSSGGSITNIEGLDNNEDYLMAPSDILTGDSFTSSEGSMMVIQDLDNNNDYPMASSGISTIELFPNVNVGGTSITDSSIYTVDDVPGNPNYF
jgi:hypothetical protein